MICSKMVHVNCNRKLHDRCASHTSPMRMVVHCDLSSADSPSEMSPGRSCSVGVVGISERIYTSARIRWNEKFCRLGRELGIHAWQFVCGFYFTFSPLCRFREFPNNNDEKPKKRRKKKTRATHIHLIGIINDAHGPWFNASIQHRMCSVCVVSIFLFHHL